MNLNEMKLGDVFAVVNALKGTKSEPSDQNGTVKIVVLQRGWVLVGRYFKDGEDCRLENASVIRTWGTQKGLGEIAEGGPTSSTKLDKCGTSRFHELTVVTTLDCEEDKWQKDCPQV